MKNIDQILAYVRANGSQTADNIVRTHGMKRGSVSKDLSRLVKRGDLVRRENPVETTKPLYYDAKSVATSAPVASASSAAIP